MIGSEGERVVGYVRNICVSSTLDIELQVIVDGLKMLGIKECDDC